MASRAGVEQWPEQTADAAGQAAPAPVERHLHGPLADWFLLGGSSLVVMPLLMLLPTQRWQATVALTMMFLANFINHPHFAHSYQIFYRSFRAKLTSGDRAMRWRYAGAGIVAPVLIIGYFAYGLATENLRMVGLGFNAMGFFVGWHYVKQGYGMLMVDAAFKKRFFADEEKKLLLINAYAVWAFAYMHLNRVASQSDYWGVRTISIAMPGWLEAGAAIVAGAAALTVLTMLARRIAAGRKLPVAGLTAYLVTLYAWTAFPIFNPLCALVIPALHSIQYLAVVYRFQTNVTASKHGQGRRLAAIAGFALTGLVIGRLLFWGMPMMLSNGFAYRTELFGTTLFMFIFWIGVNVHHYFMDSVMWRRGNPETSKHLFSR